MIKAPSTDEIMAIKNQLQLIDGLPVNVNEINRGDFIDAYCKTILIINRKPYLDQLVTGMNHYGVSFYS